jgi:putative hydrolase of the HAD superfamily
MPEPVTPRAVLFDLYRTLIDIWTDERDPRVWEGLSRFLWYEGVRLEPAEFSVRFFDGTATRLSSAAEEYAEVDIAAVFRDILAANGCTAAESLAREVCTAFRVLSTVRFQLFPDVLTTMERLYGRFLLGVVSDAQRAFFRPELAAAGLVPYLDVAVASGECGFRKPDPRPFQVALRRLGIGPGSAVYIGDSAERDIPGAQAAGMRAVLLDRGGRRGVPAGCQPDGIVGDLDEFCGWLFSAPGCS